MRCGCPSMVSVGAYRKIIQIETIMPVSERAPSTSEAIDKFVPCWPVVTAASCGSIVVGRFANAIRLFLNYIFKCEHGYAQENDIEGGHQAQPWWFVCCWHHQGARGAYRADDDGY